jgi:hypothetical protein
MQRKFSMGGFDVKAETLPTVSAGLLHAAIIILSELHLQRGPGPWVDQLYDLIVLHIKNQDFQNLSLKQEVEQVDGALTAIDALFSTISSKYISSR